MATAAVFFCAHNSSESQCAPAYVDTVRDTWLVTRLSVRAVPTPLYISPEVSWPMSFCIVHCTSSAAALGEGKMKKDEKRYNLLLTDTKWSDMIALVAEGTASYRGDRVR